MESLGPAIQVLELVKQVGALGVLVWLIWQNRQKDRDYLEALVKICQLHSSRSTHSNGREHGS